MNMKGIRAAPEGEACGKAITAKLYSLTRSTNEAGPDRHVFRQKSCFACSSWAAVSTKPGLQATTGFFPSLYPPAACCIFIAPMLLNIALCTEAATTSGSGATIFPLDRRGQAGRHGAGVSYVFN
jgi:hypothetical protein